MNQRNKGSVVVWIWLRDVFQYARALLVSFSLCSVLVVTPAAQSLAQGVPEKSQDGSRVNAQRAFDEGQRLLAEGTASSQLRAIEKFEQATALWQGVSDLRMEAISLSYIGKVYDVLGEKQKALEYYDRTLSILRTVGDPSGEATTLNNIGLIYDSLGDKEKALDYYNRALPILRTVGNRGVEAITLVNVGLAYASLGEKQKALGYYNQALPILRAVSDRGGEAVTLNNIGYLYHSLGDKQKALDYFGRALPILQEVGDTHVAAITLNNIGYAYDSINERQKALDYYNQALQVFRTVGDRRMEAFTLNNLGVSYRSQGEKQKALDFFTHALSIRLAVGDRPGQAATLSDIGSIYDLMAQQQKALNYYRQALELSRTVEDREIEASTLHRIAQVELNLGQFVKARADIEAALVIVEGLRTKIAGQELRASYFATTQQYFEFYIDLLMRLQRLDPSHAYGAMALEVSERARARNLLDVLTEARANIRQGVDPVLLNQERALEQKLNVAAERQTRLLSEVRDKKHADSLRSQTESLLTQYQELEAGIRASSPHYAALTQRAQVSLKEIQQQVLDPETILLEYALGDKKSFLFAVTPSLMKSFELPPRAEIETTARRAYDLLTARNQRIKFETADEHRIRIAKADTGYWESATILSRMLLKPVAALLGKKRLLIVADGALNYIPFAALPAPDSLNPDSGRNNRVDVQDSGVETAGFGLPLVLNHEIVSLPSASTLAILRRELSERKPATKTLAVLADPVFEKDDERVKATKLPQGRDNREQKSAEGQAAASAEESSTPTYDTQADTVGGVNRIERLRFTRQEANEILALVSETDSMKALDFAANRAAATSPELEQYRYVHFATHGVLNSANPELSALVLSLVNEQGVEQDGFLWAHEVYNLRLPAEMVVLSGCRTGLGKEIKGEGLVGLTRGFMYAGSARVLVSLWDIADEASSALMVRVYKGILGQQRLRPAAALRAAQISIWKEKRWQAPYYWAAFILQGEPR
jgi:CHAT domain-containing protein/predicted negative regulator of RcsB-dependent stress response